jgi:phenylacetate-CoA ligase
VKFQVRQERQGAIHVVVATDDQFPADGIERISNQARQRLNSDDEVTVEVVDDIQPARSGKYRPVVSRVAAEELQKENPPRRAEPCET